LFSFTILSFAIFSAVFGAGVLLHENREAIKQKSKKVFGTEAELVCTVFVFRSK
jgi:hypothetical protein